MKKHIITKTITIADGTSAGILTDEAVTLNNSYPLVESVMTQIISDGGGANLNLGLVHGEDTLEQKHSYKNWVAGQEVGHGQREKPLGFEHPGADLFITLSLDAATSGSALVVQMAFVCTKKEC